MSRIGKAPVTLPQGVKVEIVGTKVKASGAQGALECQLPPAVSVAQQEGKLVVSRDNDEPLARSMHGLARTLVNNLIQGVAVGFSRNLEINGVGYSVEQKKISGLDYLVFSLGYSHPIYFEIPKGIKATLEGKTKLSVFGADRQLVGSTAAKIRSFRAPEPYKGKGVKYADEVIRRKEGKSGGR